MAERTAAALVHEFAALGAEGEIVRPFGVGQRAGGGGPAVLARHAGRAEPNPVFRRLLGVIGAADAEGVERPRTRVTRQNVFLLPANLAETTFSTHPILHQFERGF